MPSPPDNQYGGWLLLEYAATGQVDTGWAMVQTCWFSKAPPPSSPAGILGTQRQYHQFVKLMVICWRGICVQERIISKAGRRISVLQTVREVELL